MLDPWSLRSGRHRGSGCAWSLSFKRVHESTSAGGEVAIPFNTLHALPTLGHPAASWASQEAPTREGQKGSKGDRVGREA